MRSPRHSAAWCSRGRSGVEQTYLAPSKSGSARLSVDRNRYCGQVSPKTFSPLSRAAASSATASSRRDVHDVQRRTGDPRELDGAVGGLGLQQRLADLAVVARVGPARGQRLFDQDVDGDAVLGVHHDQAAVVGGALHGAQDLAVVAVEDAGVGHEQLEGGDALLHQQVHLLERVLVHVGEDHVEARSRWRSCRRPWRARCPGPRAATCPRDWTAKSTMVVVPPQAAARVPVSKVSEAKVPPNGSSMWVWASTPPGMTYLPVASMVRSAVQPSAAAAAVRGEGGDPAVLDQDVGVDLVGGGDDEAAADDRTAHHPCSFHTSDIGGTGRRSSTRTIPSAGLLR